jgi:ATP-binding cassette subfamily B protein
LDDVGFRFPDSDTWVLRHVSVTLEPGQTLALVGATGSGKSVLAALLPRLYDVTEGCIRIDGIDIRDLSLDALREQVAVAFEDPILFSMSVAENLALGRSLDDPVTAAEVTSAIEIAAAQFVYELPFGLQTRIGEQGLSLSGGQRQRLSLARAILARPSILVLDDTLSALDVHTEATVTEALRRVLGDVTGVLVAHRASTVLLADKVALLDTVDQAGTITHIGTHEELLATVPRYRYLLAADDELDDGAEPRPQWEDEADRQQLDHVYEEAVGQRTASRLPDGYIAAERTR